MKTLRSSLVIVAATILVAASLRAQSNAPAPAIADATPHPNTAIVPAPRPEPNAKPRTDQVLQRAEDGPGAYDIAFIGDSITQGWEGGGKNVWQKYYGNRKTINLGVGGDRTQHVLWRFEQGQLDGLKPKFAVLLIGTNNSNSDRSGKEDNTTAEILEGVTAIINQIRARLPETKLIVLGIFPRGQTFSAQRGKILQVNQALARLDDGKTIFYIDFGSRLIENDGSISRDLMRDFLHLTERGYEIWAEATEPKLTELLGK